MIKQPYSYLMLLRWEFYLLRASLWCFSSDALFSHRRSEINSDARKQCLLLVSGTEWHCGQGSTFALTKCHLAKSLLLFGLRFSTEQVGLVQHLPTMFWGSWGMQRAVLKRKQAKEERWWPVCLDDTLGYNFLSAGLLSFPLAIVYYDSLRWN